LSGISAAIKARLASLGIVKAEDSTESRGFGPTEWNRDSHPGLIFHLPSSKIPFVKLVVVKEYESGVFLRDGKLYAVLPPGRWFLGKMPIVGRMEMVWVDLGINKANFGLRTLTKDGVEIGANGTVYLRVSDPERFVVNLVTGRNLFTADDIEDFLRDQINAILRAEMANYDVSSLYAEREMFSSVARAKADELMKDVGLEFRTLEVAGFLLPDEVKKALQAPLIASKEAQVTVTAGTATAEVLAKIAGAGVDPIKLRAVEALMKYAEKPNAPGGSGGPVVTGDLFMPLVFYGMLMQDGMIPSDVKDQLKKLFPQFAKSTSRKDAVSQETGRTEREENDDPLRIAKLRLAKGEITPEEYERIVTILKRNSNRKTKRR
jgi:regulator of protease activity HflC (stomatin/prohibitin superfamily)